jgi:hypothetical protein
MTLTTQQFQQLNFALENAFADASELSLLVTYGLDRDVEQIADSGTLAHVVYQVVNWAEAHSKSRELIKAAVKLKPNNQMLSAVADDLLTNTVAPQDPASARQERIGKLTKQQKRSLMEAFIDAFPSRVGLRMVVDYKLALNLAEIAPGESFRDVIYQLLEWADAEGKIAQLLEAALSVNQKSAKLHAVAGELLSGINQTPRLRDQVFISYSRKDDKWLEHLQTHLKPLVRRRIIKLWDDSQIKPGEKWREEVEKALAGAKVAVLLVTPNFLASDFIADEELPRLLEAAQKEGLVIFWIAVSASSYKATPIASFQAANDPARPLNRLEPAQRDAVLVAICEKIVRAIKEE